MTFNQADRHRHPGRARRPRRRRLAARGFPNDAAPVHHDAGRSSCARATRRHIKDWERSRARRACRSSSPIRRPRATAATPIWRPTPTRSDKTKDPGEGQGLRAKRLLANVVVFDASGRALTASFVEKGQGDVLITFEAEALGTAKEVGPGKVQVVTPPVSLLAEFPVAVVDKVVCTSAARVRSPRPI